jgi:aspartyl/asparaginyl beta-hydroxylase (cupin superfamily)
MDTCGEVQRAHGDAELSLGSAATPACGSSPDEPTIAYMPPRIRWRLDEPAPAFYDWQDTFPFLQPVIDAGPSILAEARAARRWFAWPERNLYNEEAGHEWRVFPFCYTFPGDDPSKTVWLQPAETACPRTAALLRRIPGIRTALLSRMGPKTSLATHQGWAMLSNHVLRCHLGLDVPADEANTCGMVVEDEIRHHATGSVLIFDDSKHHSAFNNHSKATRVILIVDIARPPGLPLGGATGDATEELQSFIDYFK